MSYQGLVISYDFSGDEAEWQAAVDAFVAAIDGDTGVKGAFSYTVTAPREGTTRVHIAKWADEATLKHVQAQPYFAEFAGKIKGWAGDSLATVPMTGKAQTVTQL